jgi:hypothetical protein
MLSKGFEQAVGSLTVFEIKKVPALEMGERGPGNY